MDVAWITKAPPVLLEPLFLPDIECAEGCGAGACELQILRLDQSHSAVSGNKWLKLKYSLLFAAENEIDVLISFGGAFSNHLHALAAAGHLSGFKTVGIVRGEEQPDLTPTLIDCQSEGMELVFVSRAEYKKRYDSVYLQTLQKQWPRGLIIPEGGTNELAVKGVKDYFSALFSQTVSAECSTKASIRLVVAVPVGSGGTLAGLIEASAECVLNNPRVSIDVVGVSALKGAYDLDTKIESLVTRDSIDLARQTNRFQWQLLHDYHFGGFARTTSELLVFMGAVESLNPGLVLEQVYTAKMLYALREWIKSSEAGMYDRVIAIHTGGVQGRRGLIHSDSAK